MKKNITIAIFTTLILCMFLGCSNSKNVRWETDYQKALEIAKNENKGIFLLFSGTSWDGVTGNLFPTILSSDKFKKEVSKYYVLCNIDFPETTEDLTLNEETIKNYDIADKYFVDRVPQAFIITSDELVISPVYFALDSLTPENFIAVIKKFNGNTKKVIDIENKLEKATGIKRAELLSELYDNLYEDYRSLFQNYAQEALNLDPDNQTKKMGKFMLLTAYPKSEEAFSQGNLQKAVQIFLDLAESDVLSPEEKQEAYHNAGYIIAMDEKGDINLVIEYLSKAYGAAPQSKQAHSILEMIEQMKVVEQEMQANAAASSNN